MSFRSVLPRLMVVPVVAAAIILGPAQLPAGATADVDTQTAICKGSKAVTDLSFKVDDTTVNDLRNNTEPGSHVVASFKIATGCKDVLVGLAAYKAPSASYDPETVNQQKLSSSSKGTFSADGKVHTLEAHIPDCFYQVDFITGEILQTISHEKNYTSRGDLISADNGGTEVCVTPPTTSTSTTVVTVPVTTPAQVLGQVATPAQLAATGTNASDMIMAGGALLLLGIALQQVAARLRVRRTEI